MLEFKFPKFTEITDLAFKHNPDYEKNGYVRFFICPDVWDFWYCRILKGFNSEYEKDPNCFLLEREKIDKKYKTEKLTLKKVIDIIENDLMENLDCYHSYDINELIDDMDAGFGILNLKEEVKTQ